MRNDPACCIGGSTIASWVRWETRDSVEAYTARVLKGAWGEAIEIAVFAHRHSATVLVYEAKRDAREQVVYQLMAKFGTSTAGAAEFRLLYHGAGHNDYMELKPRQWEDYAMLRKQCQAYPQSLHSAGRSAKR